MRVATFEIDYSNIENIEKENSVFILNNFLRFQFALETIIPNHFHENKNLINNAIVFLSNLYEGTIELDNESNKTTLKEIILINHKNLEDLTKKTKINEDKFSKWLKNKRNQ